MTFLSKPVMLLHALIEEGGIKAKDFAGIPGVSKGRASDILDYRKRLSKE